MAENFVLAIDQGTTNTKAILVNQSGEILARASAPLTSLYPQLGWAEQCAESIWSSVKTVINEIVASHTPSIDGLAITNQRETLVVWDSLTGKAIAPAISWQCRRTTDFCAGLIEQGANEQVVAATGLSINALFPASKLAWIIEHVPHAQKLLTQHRLRAGTVDSWLLYKLTNGVSFATDHSNASRTQLFNTKELTWDENLGRLFGVPLEILPEALPSNSVFGHTALK